jgi:transcriptional regulator with XRE-family HTH domain
MAPAELIMPIGERLKRLRTAKGMTQLELSRATGLSLSIIAQLEQGDTANPRLNTVKALAKAIGCSLDELAGDDQAEGPPEPPKRGRRKGK